MEFQSFKKIPRLSRDIIITEKIDGTNGQVYILNKEEFESLYQYRSFDGKTFLNQYCLSQSFGSMEDKCLYLFAGSKNRWLDTSSKGDNFGFAKWVQENAEQLFSLGEGRQYGEWYGKGIQRGYGLDEKRFALFNVGKWHKIGAEKRLVSINPKTKEERYTEEVPKCCDVVPILYEGIFDTEMIGNTLMTLKEYGSKIVPGFMNPEGIIIYHTASGHLYKKTIIGDEKPKGQDNG